MTINQEIKRLSKYFSQSVHQLPGAYLVDEYNNLVHEWEGKIRTEEIEKEINEALNKSLHAETLVQLNKVLTKLNSIAETTVDNSFVESVRTNVVIPTSQYIRDNNLTDCIVIIEYNYDPTYIYIDVSNKTTNDIYKVFNNNLNLTSFLDCINDETWEKLLDIFESTLVCDEPFIYELAYLVEILSFQKIEQALRKLKAFNRKFYPLQTEIHIGHHDCDKFIYLVK